MPVRKTIPEKDGVYFITFTCARWLPLFEITNGYNAVYKWFDVLKKSGHYIIGYTIMPSHVHAIIAFHNTGKTINSIVANGKRFMAYDIVTLLKEQNQNEILQQFPSPHSLLAIAIVRKPRDFAGFNTGNYLTERNAH